MPICRRIIDCETKEVLFQGFFKGENEYETPIELNPMKKYEIIWMHTWIYGDGTFAGSTDIPTII